MGTIVVKQRFAGTEFDRVGCLRLHREPTGEFTEYTHCLPPGVRRNVHAPGPFCRFDLPSASGAPGVYAILVDGMVKYVGECQNLAHRFGPLGYGSIAPRNCHADGQATNGKVNSRVLAAVKSGYPVDVWFHRTANHKVLERALIAACRPPWNSERTGSSPRAQNKGLSATWRLKPTLPAEPDFRKALRKFLAHAEANGAKWSPQNKVYFLCGLSV